MIDLSNANNAAQLVINMAESNDNFSNVEVKTLSCHYKEQLQEQALSKYARLMSSIQPNYEKIERRIQEYIESSPPIDLRQFVDFTRGDELITVCLDIPTVDDVSWTQVISVLSKCEQMTGVVEFGNPITFGTQTKQRFNIHEGNIQSFV